MGEVAQRRRAHIGVRSVDDLPMIMLAAVVLGLLPLPLFGGRITGLAQLRLRAAGLVFVAIGTQVLITSVVHPPAGVGRWLHVATYLAVLPVFWLNRRLPGLCIVFAGAAMNMAAIFANGGVMPASLAAIRAAGIDHGAAFENSAPVDGARLWFLGDVLAVPEPAPLANVFSVGDVVIVFGALVLSYRACGATWPSSVSRRDRRPGPGPLGGAGPGRPLAPGGLARGQLGATRSPSSVTSTTTLPPSTRSPSRMDSATRSATSFWMTRLSGRAPNAGS